MTEANHFRLGRKLTGETANTPTFSIFRIALRTLPEKFARRQAMHIAEKTTANSSSFDVVILGRITVETSLRKLRELLTEPLNLAVFREHRDSVCGPKRQRLNGFGRLITPTGHKTGPIANK